MPFRIRRLWVMLTTIILSLAVAAPVLAAPPKGSAGEAVQSVNSEYRTFLEFTREVAARLGVPAGQLGAAVLIREAEQMQEMQMSFNTAYLELQQAMQDESRRFTAISNVMKTKHDAMKNSISNVR